MTSVHAHFFLNQHLDKPSIKYLGLLWGIMALFKSPKETHVKPTAWNTLILWLLDSNIIGLIKRNSWSSMVSSPTLRPALDSLSVGPKDQKLPVVCYGLNVYYKWSPHYIILSLLKGNTVTAYFSTRTRGSKPFSSSLSKLPWPHQLTMVLYLIENYEF